MQSIESKYEQLQKLCKRQEQEIAKLQSQIRERCQSYLLQTTKYKQQDQPNNNSRVRLQFEKSRRKDGEGLGLGLEGRRVIIQEERIARGLKLSINQEVKVVIEGDGREAHAKMEEIASITQSFKNRIVILQNSKNDSVRQLQKSQRELLEMKQKNMLLTTAAQISIKSERKLKEKLKKLPQYEQRIDEIYVKLAREVRKQENNGEGLEVEKHFNQKLQQIIQWIQSSKQKSDGVLQQMTISLKQQPYIYKPNIQSQIKNNFQSPEKQQRCAVEGWTIVNKLNQIVGPFQASQVKAYNMSQTKRIQEEQNLIRSLQQEQENNLMLEEELNQSKKEIADLKEQIGRNRSRCSQINEDIINKQQTQINGLRHELADSRTQKEKLSSQLNKLREKLNQSRKIEEKVETLNKTQPLQSPKQSDSAYTQPHFNSQLKQSKIWVQQQLEAPYYIQQDLQTEGDQYVKRSFIRKKIVKRNLSATAYRVVSKSKDQIDKIVSNKIAEYRQKSKEKAVKAPKTKREKLEDLQNSVQRVSEVSEPRDSGINDGEEVRIIQVTTSTPNEEIRTAKIYSHGGESSLSTRRKF